MWVEGGGLEQPIEVKVAQIDGRPLVVAIRIDNQTEITSRSLRAIKVPHLAKRLVEEVRRIIDEIDPSDSELEAVQKYKGVLSHDWTPQASQALGVWEAAAEADRLRKWLESLEDADTSALEGKRRGRGAPPPTGGELRAFARVYLEEVTRGSHGAKTRTAGRLNMNRSTVYAWIRACHELSLLPSEGEER